VEEQQRTDEVRQHQNHQIPASHFFPSFPAR
jgi:hypothetical protein